MLYANTIYENSILHAVCPSGAEQSREQTPSAFLKNEQSVREIFNLLAIYLNCISHVVLLCMAAVKRAVKVKAELNGKVTFANEHKNTIT